MIDTFQHFLMSVPYLGDVRPILFYLSVFVVSIAESTPVLGTIAPGAFLMLLFGFISTHQSISLTILIMVAAIGASIGDLLGYSLGKYGWGYVNKFTWIMKFAKLESGKAFLHRHGVKSILFARFIGPIRPIVPLLAGATEMPFKKFLFWNILGSILWSSIYILLGYFFGANFELLTRWASRAGVFAFIIFITLIGLYGWKEKKTQQVIDELGEEGSKESL